MTQPRSPQGELSSALVPALVLFGGITLILIALLAARPSTPPGTSAAAQPTGEAAVAAGPTATPQPISVAVARDPARVTAGDNIYHSTCVACHGFNAMGIPGLGKTLIGSAFVDNLSDDELVTFIRTGRDVSDPLNTTGVMMPGKGGNPTLTDDDLLNVVFYIRSLNTGNAPSVASALTPAATTTGGATAPTSEPAQFAPLNLSELAAPTSIAVEPTSEAVSAAPETAPGVGQGLYNQTCAGCHGVNGEGVSLVAQSLKTSPLLRSGNGIGLLMFLTTFPQTADGQGFPHPERGGNLALTDDDLLAIIGYLYALPGQ